MATVWRTRMFQSKRQFLLANGEVVKAPTLEETSTGRKVRIQGTDISGYSRDVEDIVAQGAAHFAAQRGTTVWMMLDENKFDTIAATQGGVDYRNFPVASCHILEGRSQIGGAVTQAWWRFVHPDYPISAILSVRVFTGYTSGTALKEQAMHTSLVFQVPDPAQKSVEIGRLASYASLDVGDVVKVSQRSERETIRDYYRDNPLDTLEVMEVKGHSRTLSETDAVKSLLALIRSVEEFESIEIPDLRDPANPGKLRLHIDSSNVNGEFIESLVEYLDGAPSLEQAVYHYRQMLTALRQAGMVLGELNENDFLTALTSGKTVTVEAHKLDEYEHVVADANHSVSINLASGAVHVGCTHKANHDEIAHAWSEAKTIASLTGEEDALLAYAQAFARKKGVDENKTISRVRGVA